MEQYQTLKDVLNTLYVAKHIINDANSFNCITFAPTKHVTLPVRKGFRKVFSTSIISTIALPLYNANLVIDHKITVPVLHTVRSAGGSFFFYTYAK